MGKVFKGLFGGGSTKVKYTYPPEASATIQELRKYAEQLEQLIPQIEPELKTIYGDLLSQISTWMTEYPSELSEIMERRDVWETADIAKARTREEIGKVKEDVLRNLYRDLGMKGLISSSAGVSAITEQMKKTELEPMLDIERTAYQQELGRRLSLLSDYLEFIRSRPEIFESMAKLKETQTMVPWTLRERIMGSLSGVGQLAGQLAQPIVKSPSPGLFSQLLPLAMPFASAFAFAKWIK
jgi:hypothetical protein